MTVSNRVPLIGEGPEHAILKSYTAGGYALTILDCSANWAWSEISGIGFDGYGGVRFGGDDET